MCCSISFRTDGTYVEVVDVSLGKPEVTDDDETSYAGPVRLTIINMDCMLGTFPPASMCLGCNQSYRLQKQAKPDEQPA